MLRSFESRLDTGQVQIQKKNTVWSLEITRDHLLKSHRNSLTDFIKSSNNDRLSIGLHVAAACSSSSRWQCGGGGTWWSWLPSVLPASACCAAFGVWDLQKTGVPLVGGPRSATEWEMGMKSKAASKFSEKLTQTKTWWKVHVQDIFHETIRWSPMAMDISRRWFPKNVISPGQLMAIPKTHWTPERLVETKLNRSILERSR